MFSASFDGFAPGEGPDVLDGTLVFATTQPADNKPAGSYAITPLGLTSPNYAITIVPGTLTVLQATTAICGRQYAHDHHRDGLGLDHGQDRVELGVAGRSVGHGDDRRGERAVGVRDGNGRQ